MTRTAKKPADPCCVSYQELLRVLIVKVPFGSTGGVVWIALPLIG